MARIPLTVASRPLDTGSVVQYPSGSPVGAAISGFGNALQGAAERYRQMQEKKDAFDATLREQELTASMARLETDAIDNAPVDGQGMHDGVYGELGPQGVAKPGAFDVQFDEIKARVPESKREEFEAMRELYRLRGSNRMAIAQQQQQQKYYKFEIAKTQDSITNSILSMDPNDDVTFDAYLNNGLDIIRKSDLPELDRAEAEASWRANAQYFRQKSFLQNDPDGPKKVREMLGFGDPAAANTNSGSLVDRIIGAESGGNPNAQNSRSSAGGAGQFIDSTWVGMIRKYRPDLAAGASNDDIISMKTDGALSREMVGRLVEENTAGLRKAGLEASDRNLYLAHFAGVEGAKKLLSADDSTPVSSLTSQKVMDANPNLKGKTVGDLKAWADKKVGVSGPSAPQQDFPVVVKGNSLTGRKFAPDLNGVQPDVMSRFKSLQNTFGASIPVVSGFRDANRNAAAGGAKHSQHIQGNALDLDVSDLSREQVIQLIKQARAAGFGGIGVYGDRSLHVDTGAQRAWGPSHSSASVPAWAKEALSTPVGAGLPAAASGAGGRSVDPRASAMTPEQRLALANEALVVQNKRDAEEKALVTANYGAYKDSVELQIVRGEIRDEELIVKDQTLNDGDKATLIRSLRTQNEGANQIAADLSALTSNSLVLDPYASKDKTRADNLYSDLVKRVPPEQQGAIAGTIIQQTGVVPQPVINVMRRGMASENPAEVVTAAQLAQRISSFDSAALSRRDGGAEVQTMADLFSHYKNTIGLTDEEAARRIIDNRSPEKAAARKALLESEDTKKFIKTAATESRVRDIFDPGIVGLDPKLGDNPAQAAAMVGEYRTILEESLVDAMGDRDAARDLAAKRFARVYKPSSFTFNSGVVIRLPPEAAYPPGEDGSHDYIRNQAVEALKEQGVETDKIYLQPYDKTDADFRSGRAPRYQLYYEKDGEIEMFNFPFSAMPPQVERSFMDNISRWQENRRQLEAGRDRDQTLDNFLYGNPLTGQQ